MSHRAAGVLVIALIAAACAVEPIEDPGIGAGSLTSVVYAADGTALTEWHAGEDRVLVGYDDLPRYWWTPSWPSRTNASGSIPGVDLRAMVRAVQADLEAGEVVQGGSTITQQYIKNALLTPEVSLDRKMQEVSLALGIEQTLSKQEIFERYINTAYFGNGAYGIGAAARRYFGKEVSALTLAESALLAGLIRRPNALDPYEYPNAAPVPAPDRAGQDGRTRLADRGRSRRRRDRAPGAAARRAPPTARSTPTSPTRSAAGSSPSRPWATPRRSASRPSPRAACASTPPWTRSPRSPPRPPSPPSSPTAGPPPPWPPWTPAPATCWPWSAGRTTTTPSDPVAQFNLATLGRRQPGSAFKPFALAAALQAGIGLDAEFQGGRSAVIQTDSGRWRVENYNQLSYPNLTLLEATVFSVNVVYARLMNLLDPAAVVAVAQAAGITTPLEALPSLALGTQEVTVLDMASAYATFAAGGLHIDPILVTRIEDADGQRHLRGRPHHPEGHGARDRRAGHRRPHRGRAARHGPAGQDRPPGGRQDRHHRGPVRRLVRRLHPRDLGRRVGGLRPGRPPPPGALHPLHHHRRHLARPDLGPLRHRRPVGHPLPGPARCRPGRTDRGVHRPVHRLPRRPPLPQGRGGHGHGPAPTKRPPSSAPSTTPRGSPSPLPGVVPEVAGQTWPRRSPGSRRPATRPPPSGSGAPGRIPGTVLVQYPAADSTVAAGRRGRPDRGRARSPARRPPTSSGLTAADARRALEAYGFVVRVVIGPESNPGDAALHSGRVWSQNPAAGAAPAGDHHPAGQPVGPVLRGPPAALL